MVAEDLQKMSVTERENVFFDVHGVSGTVEESEELLSKFLAELDAKISQFRIKNAYNVAEAQDPFYVSRRSFRLRFLRSTKFDTSWAAEKVVRFFEMKRDLFGESLLTKDITLDDLDGETLASLESGLVTILPLNDPAGRAIICWTTKFRGSFTLESKVSLPAGLRVCKNAIA